MDGESLETWLHAAAPGTAAVLGRAFHASLFLQRAFERQPQWARQMLETGGFESRPQTPVAQRLRACVDEAANYAAVRRLLRQFRQRELARLALRDIAGWAPLDENLHALSDLADAACQTALEWACKELARRSHDIAEAAVPIVLGLGKLGGRELNFSSDIDLIFAYRLPPESDVELDVGHAQEYFGRLAREVAQLLSAVTEDGFVYRVDTMLRPFGRAGAPALSTTATLAYYQNHGREWERYALIKARPVAGDLEAGADLLEKLQPFVYRHYLDFGAIGALRDVKRRIDADARSHEAAEDVKLGPGGIRELEFVVQLFQLVRGGQDARLRGNGLRETLAQLGATGVLEDVTVSALDEAYVFLRRTENALQFHDDQQTHCLPADNPARAALCAALDMPDWAHFRQRLNQARGQVREVFEQVFAVDEESGTSAGEEQETALWQLEGAALEARLQTLGYRHDPQRVCSQLVGLRKSRLVRSMSDKAQSRLRECVALLVTEAAAMESAEVAICRTLDVLSAIGGRSTYLALLCESGLARGQLLQLTVASSWLTQQLAQNPSLLDTLLDARLAEDAPGRDAIFADLALMAGGVEGGDTEASMELLRRYRQETMLRIAAADLSGHLPLVQVSDRLTWLAEAVLAKALDDASVQLSARYGQPLRADGSSGLFAAIAYGKFGSLELGYGSDLDLVFIFDIDDPTVETEGGTRSLMAAQYYARLGQRVVQLLSALTGAGRAYEIDLELRPSGGSGTVVASFSGWARYQRESAWTWEHQALLRARVVAGDEALATAVRGVRGEVLSRPRDPDRLLRRVREMRDKMRVGLAQRKPGRWDVKQGSGGLVDAEFLTQYLLLCNAARHPEVVHYTDNWRQLEALSGAGVISAEDAESLVAAGRVYRNWLHRQALQDTDRLADEAQFTAQRAVVTKLWRRYMDADRGSQA